MIGPRSWSLLLPRKPRAAIWWRASLSTPGRSGEKASAAPKAEEIQRVDHWTHSRLARAHVVSRREIDVLDSAGKAARLQQQLQVSRPAAAGDGRLVAQGLE